MSATADENVVKVVKRKRAKPTGTTTQTLIRRLYGKDPDMPAEADSPQPPEPTHDSPTRHLSAEESAILEKVFFDTQQYPDWEDRHFLAARFGVAVKSISQWFIRRRLQWKAEAVSAVPPVDTGSPTHHSVCINTHPVAVVEETPYLRATFATKSTHLTLSLDGPRIRDIVIPVMGPLAGPGVTPLLGQMGAGSGSPSALDSMDVEFEVSEVDEIILDGAPCDPLPGPDVVHPDRNLFYTVARRPSPPLAMRPLSRERWRSFSASWRVRARERIL